jgi:hypothetical protein
VFSKGRYAMSKGDEFNAERASQGGKARMKKLSREERSALASEAAKARWKKRKNHKVTEGASMEVSRGNAIPKALYSGTLRLGIAEIPV